MTVEFIVSSQPIAADLGEPAPKPTATTPGVVEATSPLWSAGGTEVGFWECSPGSFTARRDGYTEICQILAGSVTVETSGGRRQTLGAGDTLVMPSGWAGVWHVHETLRKTYVTIDD
ncbi:cupin domain-containing protein [Agromyces soli]